MTLILYHDQIIFQCLFFGKYFNVYFLENRLFWLDRGGRGEVINLQLIKRQIKNTDIISVVVGG